MKSKTQITTGVTVNFTGRNGRKLSRSFPNQRQAASRLAWWMIFDKYPHRWEDDEIHVLAGGEDSTRYVGVLVPVDNCITCDCHGYHTCEIHDRKTGYIRRLHDRLAKWIEGQLQGEKP